MKIIKIKKIKNLIRKNISSLSPYLSARKIGGKGDVWLNANEFPNSYFFPDTSWNRYPDCQPNDVISRYADYACLDEKEVLVCRGADEGIELLTKLFCEPKKDKIAIFPPTYDMYRISAEIMGIDIVSINRKSNWDIDLGKIKKNLKDVKLIYLCNPNNPTGNCISVRKIEDLLILTQNKSIVVIDEAYIEFSHSHTSVNLIKKYSHLVVLRTLSKAFGLAGLRCGFILGDVQVILFLKKIIAPYPLSSPVIDAVKSVLNVKKIKLMQNHVQSLNVRKKWMKKELKKIDLVDQVYESKANYLLVKFFFSRKVFRLLWEKGIIVRDQRDKLNLKDFIRISIGTYFECFSFMKALKGISVFLKKKE